MPRMHWAEMTSQLPPQRCRRRAPFHRYRAHSAHAESNRAARRRGTTRARMSPTAHGIAREPSETVCLADDGARVEDVEPPCVAPPHHDDRVPQLAPTHQCGLLSRVGVEQPDLGDGRSSTSRTRRSPLIARRTRDSMLKTDSCRRAPAPRDATLLAEEPTGLLKHEVAPVEGTRTPGAWAFGKAVTYVVMAPTCRYAASPEHTRSSDMVPMLVPCSDANRRAMRARLATHRDRREVHVAPTSAMP